MAPTTLTDEEIRSTWLTPTNTDTAPTGDDDGTDTAPTDDDGTDSGGDDDGTDSGADDDGTDS
jgi:hypothetical protein